MIVRLSVVATVSSLLCACATPGAQIGSERLFAEAQPICAILANPKPFVGKRILVRGYVTQNPHRWEFWDDGCGRGFLNVHEARNARVDRRQSKLESYMRQSKQAPPRAQVVFSGVFTDNSPALICEGLCSKFTLEAAKLVAAHRS